MNAYCCVLSFGSYEFTFTNTDTRHINVPFSNGFRCAMQMSFIILLRTQNRKNVKLTQIINMSYSNDMYLYKLQLNQVEI